MNQMIKTMDIRVVAATGAVPGAASLCGLLPLQTKLGRSVCNFESHHRIFMRKAAIRAGGPGGKQSGSGTLIPSVAAILFYK